MHQHVIGNLHACMHDDDNGDHVLIAYLQVNKYVLDSRGLYGYICHMVRVGLNFLLLVCMIYTIWIWLMSVHGWGQMVVHFSVT